MFCPLYQNSQTIRKRENGDSEAQNIRQGHTGRRITEHLNVTFCCGKMDEICIKMKLKVHSFSHSRWHSGRVTLVQNKNFPNVHLSVWLVRKTHLFGYKSRGFSATCKACYSFTAISISTAETLSDQRKIHFKAIPCEIGPVKRRLAADYTFWLFVSKFLWLEALMG